MKPLFTLICFTISFQSFAAHIVGGDLTYQFVQQQGTTNTYEFTMNVYRDIFSSNGASLDQVATISVFRSDVSPQLVKTVGIPLTSRATLPKPILPWLNIPPNLGVEMGVYKFTLDLPIIQGNYTIAYQRCCRNGTIGNIVNPLEVGATFSTEITAQAQLLRSSSPVFTANPPILVCSNEPINLMQNATDADGDRLIYRLCSAYQGGSTTTPSPNPASPPPFLPIIYAQGFSATQPVNGQPAMSIDSLTGRLIGRPNTLGQFVVSVCVEKYRNNILLAKIQRDFQLNIISCQTVTNSLAVPILTSPNDNSILNSYNNIALSWTSVPLASSYLVELGQTPDLGDAFQFVSNNANLVVDNIQTSGFLKPNQQYFWRVRAFRTTEMISDYSQTFKFKTSLLNSLNNTTSTSNFSIFPNPIKQNATINIVLETTKALNTHIELTDLCGKLIFSEKKDFPLGITEYSIPCNQSLSQGIYFLTLSHQEGRSQRKIVVQN